MWSGYASASAKSVFVDAVVAQCKLSAADATKLATPGRTGTVVQFKLCITPTIEAGGDCRLNCNREGSVIGS
ncbi:hypothetical protein OAB57_02930 [Bacteriovoracaceae bacterium]|nr:hypothetical protein [Bacteriovoracaceae bacterium]